MGAQSVDGYQAIIPGKIVVSRSKAGEVSVEKAVYLGDTLTWQTIPTDSAEAAVPVAAFERAMETVHDYGIPQAYRPTTVANWAANQAVFFSLMGESHEDSIRLGWRSAISIAHMPEHQAFKELGERGLETDKVQWQRAERMLANAERFGIAHGARAVLVGLRDGFSPAGNMATLDDQMDALSDQFPALEARSLGVAMLPRRPSASVRLAAQSGDVEQTSIHAQHVAVHAVDSEEERLRTVAACRKALGALSGNTSYKMAGITIEREGEQAVAYVKAPLRASLARTAADGQIDAPCSIARLPAQHSPRDLVIAVRDFLADNAIHVGQAINTLAAKLNVPDGHEVVFPDLQSDIRFNLIMNGNDISLRVRPTDRDRADMGALNVELRIFTDSPHAHLFMKQGDPTNFRGVDFVPEGAKFPKAPNYSTLIDQIAKTFNEAVPVALAKAGVTASAGAEVEFDEDAEDFVISLVASKYTEADLDAGEAGETEELIESEAHSLRDLKRLMRDRGISLMQEDQSVSSGATFVSQSPDENRAYFEDGVHTYYRLTLEKVRGVQATPEDAAEFADRFNIKHAHEHAIHAPNEKRGPAMRMG